MDIFFTLYLIAQTFVVGALFIDESRKNERLRKKIERMEEADRSRPNY